MGSGGDVTGSGVDMPLKPPSVAALLNIILVVLSGATTTTALLTINLVLLSAGVDMSLPRHSFCDGAPRERRGRGPLDASPCPVSDHLRKDGAALRPGLWRVSGRHYVQPSRLSLFSFLGWISGRPVAQRGAGEAHSAESVTMCAAQRRPDDVAKTSIAV